MIFIFYIARKEHCPKWAGYIFRIRKLDSTQNQYIYEVNIKKARPKPRFNTSAVGIIHNHYR